MSTITNQPAKMGSYSEDDVLFLLKDLSNIELEDSTVNREIRVQSGEHYSESLPIEYQPPKEYVDLFWQTITEYKRKVALCVGLWQSKSIKLRVIKTILVSLAEQVHLLEF